MADQTLRQKRRRLSGVVLVLFSVACADGAGGGCGDTGCGIGEPVPYPNNGNIIDQSLQVRVTPTGLAFIENNSEALISEFLGTEQIEFCIPPSGQVCYDPGYNDCGTQGPGCLFDAAIDSIELTPADGGASQPDRLDVTIVLTDIDENVPATVLGACDSLHLASDALPVHLSIVFHIDEETERTWIEIANIDIEFRTGLQSNVDVTFQSGDQDLSCGFYVAGISALGDLIEPFFTPQITSAIDQALCVPCDQCDQYDGAACGGDPEVCRYGGAGECVPIPLGIETGIDLAAALSGMSLADEALLHILLYLANYADAENGGLSLGGQLGFHAEHDACVPSRPVPEVGRVPKAGDLIRNLTPFNTNYMVGLGLSERALNLALWSVYQSGAMCLAVGSDTVDQLTSSTLSIILQSLVDLTEGRNVPLIVRVRPTQPPTAELGAGTVLMGDPPTISEPLITLRIEQLQIDFYAYIEERYARIFTLDTDLAIPVALTPSDDGTGIQVLLGDMEQAFERVTPVDAELLAEADSERLAEVLPSLIGAFLPQILAGLADPFELPAFAGYRLSVEQESFTSIEDDTMLAIFANLVRAEEPAPAGLRGVPRAVAEIEAVFGPSAADIARFEASRDRAGVIDIESLRSQVVLAVDTVGPNSDGQREYSYRIDRGPWHLYQASRRLVLDDAEFLLEGLHTIQVRSRVAGQTGTMSLASEPVEVLIDLASPEVTLYRTGEREVDIEAFDSQWPASQLRLRYRIDGRAGGGEWSATSPVVPVELPAPTDRDASVEVEVEVTDPAGRQTLVRRTFALHGREHVASEGGGGCQDCSTAGGRSGSATWAPIFLALGLLLTGRRRRSGGRGASRRALPWLALLAAAALVLGACGDDPSTSSLNPDAGDTGEDAVDNCTACGPDQICVDNACADNTCDSDDQCPDSMACVGDHCMLRTRCTDDVDCGDILFCIDDDDDGGSECLSAPCDGNADCAEYSCGTGRQPFCTQSSCACEVPCADGCGDGEYCCNATRSCEVLPTECEPLECDPGFGPGIVTPAEGDPNSCEVTDPECGCLELPPLPIGDAGAYLSSAASGGTIYVAAFNRTYEDLIFGPVGEDGTIDWSFIDGVPDEGVITGSLNGPRGGISDPGPRVGRYTSLAISDDGVFHLAYFDRSENALKYAHGVETDGEITWTFQVVDDTETAGSYTSVTLSSGGIPGIAYFVQRVEVEPGVWHAQIRYAWGDDVDPKNWTVEVVDSQLLPDACGGPCSGSQRCNGATNRCEQTARSSRCDPGCTGDDQCFESGETYVCGPVVATSSLFFLNEGTGLFADSARFASGEVALVYYDHTDGNLMYAASASGTFTGVTPQLLDGEGPDGDDLDELPDDTGDVGWYPSVTVTDGDAVHITYVDATHDDLRHLELSVGTPSVVDAGERVSGSEILNVLVGDDSSLVVLPDGTLQVAYMDSFQHDVLVTQRSSEGLWEPPVTVLGDDESYTGAYGFYLDQLLVDGETVLLTYRINTREATRDVVVSTVE